MQLTLGYLSTPVAAAVTAPLLARSLGPEGRGQLAALLVPAQLLMALTPIGVGQAAALFAGSDPDADRRTLVLTTLGTGALGAGVYFAAARSLDLGTDALLSICLFTMMVAFAPLSAALRGLQQADGRLGRLALETTATAWLRALALIAVATLTGLSLTGASAITAGASVLGLLVVGWGLRLRRRSIDDSRPSQSLDLVAMYRFGAVVGVGSVVALGAARADQLVLVSLVSTRDLGEYASAVALAELPLAAVAALRTLLYSRLARGMDDEAIGTIMRLIVAFTLVASVGLLIVGPPVVSLLFGSEYEKAPMLIALMSATLAPLGVLATSASVLEALRRPWVSTAVTLVAVLAGLASLLLLAPSYGVFAAPVATAMGYGCAAAVGLFTIKHVRGIPLKAMMIPRAGDLTLLIKRRATSMS